MGNSEVGHLNIGAGRVVEQDLTRIHNAIEKGELGKLPEMRGLIETVKGHPGSALHLIGLVSLGGVHSHLSHLEALISEAASSGVKHIFVHAITDGRDRPPTVAVEEVGLLQKFIEKTRAEYPHIDLGISTIIGRYFAMDRDTRWERTQKGYDLFTLGKGEVYRDPIAALKARIAAGAKDEFLEPIVIENQFSRSGLVEDGDSVLFFNFRADRMRQIVPAFLGDTVGFKGFKREKAPKLAQVCTLTEYDAEFPVEILFRQEPIKDHFGEVVSRAGLTQLRIAETEKYAHVTYFFNGGSEVELPGESRIMIPSPRDVATYDLKPEMSAAGVTDALCRTLEKGETDVVIVNFANCDMVGHTGVFEAAVKAVETVDACVGRVLESVKKMGGFAFITADHGNADQMIDYDTGGPHTFHTTHPVWFIVYGENLPKLTLRSGGALCDIAPTACELMGLEIPSLMTGQSLISGR